MADDNKTCTPMEETAKMKKKAKGSSDARFRFCLSEDKMKLGISQYTPPSKLGAEATVDSICRQIAEAGVKLDPDRAAAKRIISILQNGGGIDEISGITLVRGVEVQEPEDASIEPQGDLTKPVFPGDRFAEYSPPKLARNGETIDGVITKPKDNRKAEDIKPEAGENCDFDARDGGFTATTHGIARIEGGRVSVAPCLRVTSDEIKVLGDLYDKDFRGLAVTPDRIVKVLHDMEIGLEPDLDWLDKELERAAKSRQPRLNKTVIKGKRPIDGRDGWLEYLVATREEAGTEDDQGRIDYRNRGLYPSVTPDQTVARLHPPTQGEAGVDVYGKTIPANAGRELTLHAGENIEVSADGITFTAKDTGILVVEKNTVSVTQCLVIHGDVNLGTGNVRTDEGSVKVTGNVLSGFKVEAPKHVIVEGSVESADIKAGGDVSVKGGILQPDGGTVFAGGEVVTGFAANATIRAGRSLVIKNECSNCRVQTPYLLAAKGKGVVQGGVLVITKGMEVNELGSELGVPTTISVGIGSEKDSELIAERTRLKKELQKIDHALGGADPKDILQRTPEAKRPQVAKIIKHRMNVAKRFEDTAARAAEMTKQRISQLSGVKIKVRKQIHPGVLVKMGGKTMKVKNTLERSMIFWHPGKDDIEVGNL